ncbi:MAG: ExbD/TolR family protein [Gammaproteobacteria bacterium]|jgi:biopolymer transport protein TolR
MLFNNKKSRRQVAEINVVPYVDVMLVLLVIFMATAPIIMQGVQVDLPKMQAKAIDSKKDNFPVVVSIDEQENLYLNIAQNPTKPIDQKQLQLEVAAAILRDPSRLVTVRADSRVSYKVVLRSMVLLQTSGVVSVGLETGGNS